MDPTRIRMATVPRSICHFIALAVQLMTFKEEWISTKLPNDNVGKTLNEEKLGVLRIMMFHHVLSGLLHAMFSFFVRDRNYLL